MDKDASTTLEDKKSSDESVELGEITFEDLIRADDDPLRCKDTENKSFIDPLCVKDEVDEGVVEKLLKKITPSPVDKEVKKINTPSSSKSIILATTTNNNVIQNKLVATTTASAGFIKIAPRSNVTTASSTSSTITTTASAARASNGKIIYLQRPGGAVRVPSTLGANASTNNAAKQTVAIHVIRTADGNLVPVKGGKSINIPNVSQLAGKKIITTTGGGTTGQMLIKAPIKTVSGTTTPGGATTTTSVGSTIISSVKEAKSKVRQIIAGASNGNTSGSGKMVMQSASGARQVMVSQNVIKLSPNTSGGQLQAIQIPGKSGLQYVRVLNNTSGITHKIATSDTTTAPKYTVVRQTKPQMKIMVKSPLNDKDRPKMMATVPTLRKLNEVMVKPQDASEGGLVRTQKISQINSQIQRFSNTGESKAAVPGSKYIVVSQSLIRTAVTSQNQKITQQRESIIESQKDAGQSPPPAKKLYSVLRPNADDRDVKLKARAAPVTSKSMGLVGRSSRSSPPPSDDSSVTIRRKHCNCTKSQCLKLYCDCFANGEFCQDCNCKDCLNNLDNEDERQKAIRICLERNPNSFKPKITAATNESDQRLHNKGCNCKRSGCLKNYCECYEAKIPCSSNCKCVGCRNIDDHPDLDMDLKKFPVPTVQTYNRLKRPYDDGIKPRTPTLQPNTSAVPTTVSTAVAASTSTTACGPTAEKQPCNFITQDVVDATIQCLIAQADECKKGALSPHQTEKLVMEELGRCLVEIIDFSIRNTDQN